VHDHVELVCGEVRAYGGGVEKIEFGGSGSVQVVITREGLGEVSADESRGAGDE
jgi:hypothetical protein